MVIFRPLSNENVRKVSNSYIYLKNIKLADSSDKKIKDTEILIGLDYYYQIVISEIIRGKKNEPIALGSMFGWDLWKFTQYIECPFERHSTQVSY